MQRGSEEFEQSTIQLIRSSWAGCGSGGGKGGLCASRQVWGSRVAWGVELVLAGRPRVSRQEGNWPGSGTRIF